MTPSFSGEKFYNFGAADAEDPVSFHKFVETDPIRNYEKWFKETDDLLLQRITSEAKDELWVETY